MSLRTTGTANWTSHCGGNFSFIDMFIPALITSPTLPLETRFVIASLSLVQIIYLTEVGSIIVKSGVGLNIPKLFVIFVERTLIALPLIVLVAKYCL